MASGLLTESPKAGASSQLNLMEDTLMADMKEVTIKLTEDQRNQIRNAIGQDITEVKVSADRGNPLAATPLTDRANPLLADRANPTLADRANPTLADRANPVKMD